MTNEELISCARKAKEKAYAPYSNFFVGAALLCDDGSVYQGCNVENASFSVTCCAERVALFNAVYDKKRKFSAIAIVGDRNPCYPCGVCRQALSEFCSSDLAVILLGENEIVETTLGELFPNSFDL